MLLIELLVIALLFLVIYYLTGGLITGMCPHLCGFELIIGYFLLFGIFHVISVLPAVFHFPVSFIYYTAYPIIVLVIPISIILSVKNKGCKINYFLFVTSLIFISLYFMHDFIVPGDSTFYLSLIRSVNTQKKIYLYEPWSGGYGFPGYMYYFVTYELYLGTLSRIFNLDSTVFTVNVISFIHLVVILSTTYTFFRKILCDKEKTAFTFLLYLFVLCFLNSNLHRVFFTHNAFNLMTNIYAGKTVYLNALVTMEFFLINRIIKLKSNKDIIILSILNLITPGITASALYLQLVISLVIIIYLMIFHCRKNDRFYGFFLLSLLIPLMLNYQFIIYAPDFPFSSWYFKIGIEVIFLIILCIGFILVFYGKTYIFKYHKHLRKLFYLFLALIGVISVIGGTYLLYTKNTEIKNGLSLLPEFKELFFLYGYDLLLFYILGVIGVLKVYKMYPEYRFLFYDYLLIMILVFVNPLTFPFVAYFITSIKTYHRILFIIPLHFINTLYLLNLKRKVLLIWLILIILPFNTIFNGLNKTAGTDFYYKVDKDVVLLGHQLDKPYRIIAEEKFINELPIVTNNYYFVFTINDLRQVPYNINYNQELYELYLMVNDKSHIPIHTFAELIKKYEIECVIVSKNNPNNDIYAAYFKLAENYSTPNVNVYLRW